MILSYHAPVGSGRGQRYCWHGARGGERSRPAFRVLRTQQSHSYHAFSALRLHAPMKIKCHGSFPKVRKTFRAAVVTFDKEADWSQAAASKWLAIMKNTVNDVRHFQFYHMLVRWVLQEAKEPVIFEPGHKDWWQKGLHYYFTEEQELEVESAVVEEEHTKPSFAF